MSNIYFIIRIIQIVIIEPFAYNYSNELNKEELEANYINEILANIRLVKSFGTEKKEINRIENIRESIKKTIILRVFYNILMFL